METINGSVAKRTIMAKVGFLKWAQLDPTQVEENTICDTGVCFISPDVNNLHLLWQDGDGEWRWEQMDWHCDNFLVSLWDEIGDDSWECLGTHNNIYKDVLSDYHTHTKETTPVLTIEELLGNAWIAALGLPLTDNHRAAIDKSND